MTEVVQDVSLNEINQEIIVPEQQEVQVTQESLSELEVPVKEEPQDKNWKRARQIMDEQKYQIDHLQRQIESLRIPVKEEAPESISDDDFIQARHLNRRLAEMEQKLQAKEASSAIDRIRSRYDDFDDVVSPENVQLLKQNDPELARSLQALANDPYEQAMAAYKLIKRSNYVEEKTHAQDKERIKQNISKPTSVQAVRKQGALGEANRFANGLTPELKKSLLQEMEQCSKQGR